MLGSAMPSMAQDLISKDSLIHNPMLWADVPDPDVIRVGDTYYLLFEASDTSNKAILYYSYK